MKRTTIQLSKEVIIFLISLVIGIFCVACGIHSLVKEKRVMDFASIDVGTCVQGEYVSGNIDSYVVKNLVDLGDGRPSGISVVLLTGGREYSFYTIPIKDNQYIRIMVSDPNKVEELEKLYRGRESGILFEGEIVKAPVAVNDKWYEDIMGTENFDVSDIIADYVVRETDFKNKRSWFYAGVVLLLYACLQFLTIGGLNGLITKEDVEEPWPVFPPYAKSYNEDNERLLEQTDLEILNRRKQARKISFLCRLAIAVAGVFIVIWNYYWEIKAVGILLVVMSVKGMIDDHRNIMI